MEVPIDHDYEATIENAIYTNDRYNMISVNTTGWWVVIFINRKIAAALDTDKKLTKLSRKNAIKIKGTFEKSKLLTKQ